MKIHPIPPGLYCVPSAICAITGADLMSVIVPSLNRHMRSSGLMDTVPGANRSTFAAVLEELGYRVRSYKDGAAGALRARISTWARRSRERWPGRVLLVTTSGHCLVIHDGVVYDTHVPHGAPGEDHPYARSTVVWAALVEPK